MTMKSIKRICVWCLLAVALCACAAKQSAEPSDALYAIDDVKTIAEDKLGMEYMEKSPDEYLYGMKLGDQSCIEIAGYAQDAPFDRMYLLPCNSARDADALFQSIKGVMDNVLDETDDAFNGMYYMSDASAYEYVCRKSNLVVTVMRVSSNGAGPLSDEEMEAYAERDREREAAFQDFIENELPSLWTYE